jgi:peptidoglycan/LPS O-acetylase OafA/YrhL
MSVTANQTSPPGEPGVTTRIVSAATTAEGTAPAGSPTGRLYALDLLRFMAAVSVAAFHLAVDDKGAWGGNPAAVLGAPLHAAAKYGWLGVEFFFVISGFVICMSCWGRPASAFFVSRVTRIMPAYLFAVLFTAGLLTAWPLADGRPEPSHVLLHLTFLQPFLGIPAFDTIYWTLFVELKFYLLFAVVAYFGLTYRRVVLFCMVWTTLALWSEMADFAPFSMIFEPQFVNYFVIGIVLHLMHRFRPNLLLWCILGVSVGLSVHWLWQRTDGFPPGLMSFPVVVSIMFTFYLIMIAVSLGWFTLAKWRWLVTLGALTYPLYLLHAQLGRVLIRAYHGLVPAWALLAMISAALLLLAYVVYRWVERPAARFLRRGLASSIAEMRAVDRAAPGEGPPSRRSGDSVVAAPRRR